MIILLIMILLSTGSLTVLERKVLSLIGFRVGPMKPTISGLVVFLYDAAKTFVKQTNMLVKFSFFFYYINSYIILSISMLMWYFLPMNPLCSNLDMSLMFILMFLSIHTINLIIMGWSLNSSYSLLSIMRMIIQMTSYELIMFMMLLMWLFFMPGFDLYNFMNSYFFLFMPVVMMFWFISSIMELGRTPFDYPESESELVSGFNIEYGSNIFSMVYLSEYMNILWMSSFSMILMMNIAPIELYIMMYYYIIIIVRSMLPRMMYFIMPNWCWKFLLFLLTYLLLILIINI